MASREGVKGYLLEEILAYLIRKTGYRLLVHQSQDPVGLAKKGNGLVVKGRGGVHQVDVLGQLAWIPAFTFPIRLFVEAKCRGQKTDIAAVRNAVGVVDDLNQKYVANTSGLPPMQRFSYRYALFSTSGFTKPAVEYAMAHQISTVDLSGDEFYDLRNLLESLADIVMPLIEEAVLTPLRDLRLYTRRILETLPVLLDEVETQYVNLNSQRQLDRTDFSRVLQEGVDRFDELLVGVANGPFLLIFRANDLRSFLEYARNNPVHEVYITWPGNEQDGRQWSIQPAGGERAYTLSFALPEVLGKWIFGEQDQAVNRAISAKERFFPSITIYRWVGGRDEIYRLNWVRQ